MFKGARGPGAKGPGSEWAMEQKSDERRFQGANWPGSYSLQGANWPESKKAVNPKQVTTTVKLM